MDYLEDGKTVFKLRLRLCSSLFPVNERIRDFFVEYDRHTLHTSPPWGSELLEVTILLLANLMWRVDVFAFIIKTEARDFAFVVSRCFIFCAYMSRSSQI
jgi:hypothetical protein